MVESESRCIGEAKKALKNLLAERHMCDTPSISTFPLNLYRLEFAVCVDLIAMVLFGI